MLPYPLWNTSRINVGSLSRLTTIDLVAVSPLYVVFEVVQYLDPEYLLNWFNTDEFKRGMLENIEGGVRDSLSYDGLSNIIISCPSNKSEQAAIANCLSNYDDLIAAATEELEGYKLLKKSMLQKMFV